MKPRDVVIILSMLAAFYSWTFSKFRMDTLFYVAEAYRFSGMPLQEVHGRVYSEFQSVYPDSFNFYTTSTEAER